MPASPPHTTRLAHRDALIRVIVVTEAELDRASDAVWDAGCRFARTRATTFAGASEMLSLITTGNTTGLFSVGRMDWHETAFRNVAAGLAKLARAA
jgi:hypothetical protein